jgi:F-type H+-transporting ATPase subunit gamma
MAKPMPVRNRSSCISNSVFLIRNTLVEIFKTASPNEPLKRKLFIVISSDKGLCGGVHSSLSKLTRRTLADPKGDTDPDSPIVIIGDKAKAQLTRAVPKNIVLTINQIGKDVPTFADAAGVADLILEAGVKYDSVGPIIDTT